MQHLKNHVHIFDRGISCIFIYIIYGTVNRRYGLSIRSITPGDPIIPSAYIWRGVKSGKWSKWNRLLEDSHLRMFNIYIYVEITGPEIYHHGRKQSRVRVAVNQTVLAGIALWAALVQQFSGWQVENSR